MKFDQGKGNLVRVSGEFGLSKFELSIEALLYFLLIGLTLRNDQLGDECFANAYRFIILDTVLIKDQFRKKDSRFKSIRFVCLRQCSWPESYNLPSTKRIIQSRYT